MVNTVQVNADHGSDLNPLAGHMTKLRNFTKGEICEFSVFPFSLQLLFDQTLSTIIISDFTKTTYKSCTNEPACCSRY